MNGAVTWILFHSSRIWVGGRWPTDPIGRAIGYAWEDRDRRLAAAFEEAGHPLTPNKTGWPLVLDEHNYRYTRCGSCYPGATLFAGQPAGPFLPRILRSRTYRTAIAGLRSLAPATVAELAAWAMAEDLQDRHPHMSVAIHSPTLAQAAAVPEAAPKTDCGASPGPVWPEVPASMPWRSSPRYLVLWDRGRGWVWRVWSSAGRHTAIGDTGGTLTCGYEGPDAFGPIDQFLADRVPVCQDQRSGGRCVGQSHP